MAGQRAAVVMSKESTLVVKTCCCRQCEFEVAVGD
jgi:hypothetical protein